MLDEIREQIDKLADDGNYNGLNGDALRELDISDLGVMIDRLESHVDKILSMIDDI